VFPISGSPVGPVLDEKIIIWEGMREKGASATL
jgi:hypothetical protein